MCWKSMVHTRAQTPAVVQTTYTCSKKSPMPKPQHTATRKGEEEKKKPAQNPTIPEAEDGMEAFTLSVTDGGTRPDPRALISADALFEVKEGLLKLMDLLAHVKTTG